MGLFLLFLFTYLFTYLQYVVISAAEPAPPVARVEEVRTSCEDTASVSDNKLVTDSLKQLEHDKTSSAGGCSSTASATPASQKNSAMSAGSSVNSDSTVAACSEAETSTVATESAKSTAPSASEENPAADAEDDNTELTLLVETLHLVPC